MEKPADKYITLVVRIPDGDTVAREALRSLEPYTTAMSMQDEMTVLDFIEEHEDFPDYIAQDARGKARKFGAARRLINLS